MTLRRASGEAPFAADLEKPGALHLAIRRSPLAHGRVVRTDGTSARSLPGVTLVLTSDDASGLLDTELRYVGDCAAVVVAEDAELARRGAKLVDLEIEPLVPVLDPDEASVDPARVLARVEVGAGHPTAEMARADRVVERTLCLPFVPAMSLEPSAALTWLDEDRRLVVRTSAESPFRVRGRLAERLGLPAARIRVARPLVAGGAARRADISIEELCALVTLRTGRPARLALTMEEELVTAPGHPPQRVSIRLGLRERRITSLRVSVLADLGDAPEGAEELLRSAGRQALGLYDVGHVAFEARAVRTHRPPTAAPRGADMGVGFALECAVNEAARVLDEDPLAFRRRHLPGPREGAREVLEGLGEAPDSLDPQPLALLVDAGARGGGWTAEAASALHAAGSRRARGVGLARRSTGATDGAGAAASLRLLDDGSLTLAAAPSSAGGADETAYAEAAAEILGLPLRRVVPAAADTDSAPFQSGDPAPAFFATGRAVEEAASMMRLRILEEGARLLGMDPSGVTVNEGAVRDGAGRSVDYAAIGAAALRAGRPLAVTTSPSAVPAPCSSALVSAEVDVDEVTGVVRVLGLQALLAGGPYADPRPAEGQVEGALAAAVELALAAGFSLDEAGRPAAHPLRHFSLLSAGDVPPLSVRFLPTGEPPSRFGAAAVGETAARAAVAAILGAVESAVGGRIDTLPATPPRVLEALEPAERH